MIRFDALTTGRREETLIDRLRSGSFPAVRLEEEMPSFFFKVQIQTISYCNASCITCPYPVTKATQPMGRMSSELFRSIADQLRGRGVERTSLFLMNEPLIDQRLEEFAAYLRSAVPETRITLITNGSLLDADRAKSLAAAGVGEIAISFNGFDKKTYEETMHGLDHEKLLDNLRMLGECQEAGELPGLDLRIVALDMGNAREQASRMQRLTRLPVYLKPLTNRAGAIQSSSRPMVHSPAAARTLCQRPFVKAYILYDGRVLLCNCDWSRTTVVGDLHEQTLYEIWNGPTLMACRRGLLEGPLPQLCQGCDYPALLDSPHRPHST